MGHIERPSALSGDTVRDDPEEKNHSLEGFIEKTKSSTLFHLYRIEIKYPPLFPLTDGG